ncbi:BQ2448_2369 [Microbotryum intermedium]|uniref:BQ2448_2369 protein n=1 Tax=Microbotryum intermedium TaxID=269621 RepID=A0A238F9B8_9BASI|nr:BQ2448_2369 [Microbotryum intermedium]
MRSDELVNQAAELATQRYESRPTVYARRQVGSSLDKCFASGDTPRAQRRFQKTLRMTRTAFNQLHDAERHPVFQSKGKKRQTAVKDQLAVALWRFGGFGNRASAEAAADWSDYSLGAVLMFTNRVTFALNDPEFRRNVIRWPNRIEREASKKWMEETTCWEWRNGWCMVDGTLVPIARRPKWFSRSFTSRKISYAINVQIVNTPDGRIIDYSTGSTGSVADVTVWRQSRIHQNRRTLLDPDDFVLADSGYPLEKWVMTSYARRDKDIPENKEFNYYVSKARCRSEHTIGYLKNRFQSLKGLTVRINSSEEFDIAKQWVGACIIAHRFATEVDWFVCV